ncbi:uncharacterized protein [Engystomops pustulosus]|uniref:uncharacterized protein n=1 Tax=Engystomops pustulosus TaxID=76066 RepID=UPI003AFB08C0
MVALLSLKITKSNGGLITNLYRKKTATNSLLHHSSFHPDHLKTGIPVGQFIQIKRNCTLQEDFHKNASELTGRLRNRGYPRKTISNAYIRARDWRREDLLTTKNRTSEFHLGVVTTYNNQWSEILAILSKNWNILRAEPRLRPLISEKPTLIAKRARNLKDSLSNSHFKRPTRPLGRGSKLNGSYPCGSCSVCPLLPASREFMHPTSAKKFPLRNYINCRSRNVVYALICLCRKIYVGQTTQELRKRTQQHLSSITNAGTHFSQGKTLSTVAAHFRNFHASKTRGLSVVGLDEVTTNIRGGDTIPELLRREARWIYYVGTRAPDGINKDLLFTGFYKNR